MTLGGRLEPSSFTTAHLCFTALQHNRFRVYCTGAMPVLVLEQSSVDGCGRNWQQVPQRILTTALPVQPEGRRNACFVLRQRTHFASSQAAGQRRVGSSY